MRRGAVEAAKAAATDLGLAVDDVIVLQDANRLVVRLTGCDAVARVAHGSHRESAAFELDLARSLVAAGGVVVAEPDPRCEPRVHHHGELGVTFWRWYQPTGVEVPAPAYAAALEDLHAAMRRVDAETPHLTDRVTDALEIVDDPARSPDLEDDDRAFLASSLRGLRDAVLDRGADEQLLHGEPHPGNLLATAHGARFVDLETCCRGPVAFDLAHAPVEVGAHYAGADASLIADCRDLARALVTAWRWDVDDVFPDGRAMGVEWLATLRASMGGR